VLFWIVKLQKWHDLTEELVSTTFILFFLTFFNTAVLIFIVNFDMDIGLPEGFPILKGWYQEFTVEWYQSIGSQLLLTMIIGIFSPHIANMINWTIEVLLRLWDQKCRCNSKRTRQIFQVDYEWVHTHSNYLIEYWYSQLITLMYVTFMYGSGMPLLYIIALVSIFCIYWMDKISLLRWYKTPPRYSSKLMARAWMWMTPMLVIHLCLGFWMFSNSTIFETDKEVLFGHTIGS